MNAPLGIDQIPNVKRKGDDDLSKAFMIWAALFVKSPVRIGRPCVTHGAGKGLDHSSNGMEDVPKGKYNVTKPLLCRRLISLTGEQFHRTDVMYILVWLSRPWPCPSWCVPPTTSVAPPPPPGGIDEVRQISNTNVARRRCLSSLHHLTRGWRAQTQKLTVLRYR